MARVTVEDCVVKIPNRFDLVMLAAQRARDIASGASLTIDRDNDKNPVVSLREIADETISLENLAESLVQGMQKHVEVDEPEEDAPEFDVPTIPGVELGAVDGGEAAPEPAVSEEVAMAEIELGAVDSEAYVPAEADVAEASGSDEEVVEASSGSDEEVAEAPVDDKEKV